MAGSAAHGRRRARLRRAVRACSASAAGSSPRPRSGCCSATRRSSPWARRCPSSSRPRSPARVSYARRGLVDVRAGLRHRACGRACARSSARWLADARRRARPCCSLTAVLIAVRRRRHGCCTRRDASRAAAAAARVRRGDRATAPRRAPARGRADRWRSRSSGSSPGCTRASSGSAAASSIVPAADALVRLPDSSARSARASSPSRVLAMPGTITHYLLGHVDWPLALALVARRRPGRARRRAGDRGARPSARVRIGFAVLLAARGRCCSRASELGGAADERRRCAPATARTTSRWLWPAVRASQHLRRRRASSRRSGTRRPGGCG